MFKLIRNIKVWKRFSKQLIFFVTVFYVRMLIEKNEEACLQEQKLEAVKIKDQEIEKLKANANKFLLVFCTIVY